MQINNAKGNKCIIPFYIVLNIKKEFLADVVQIIFLQRRTISYTACHRFRSFSNQAEPC